MKEVRKLTEIKETDMILNMKRLNFSRALALSVALGGLFLRVARQSKVVSRTIQISTTACLRIIKHSLGKVVSVKA